MDDDVSHAVDERLTALEEKVFGEEPPEGNGDEEEPPVDDEEDEEA